MPFIKRMVNPWQSDLTDPFAEFAAFLIDAFPGTAWRFNLAQMLVLVIQLGDCHLFIIIAQGAAPDPLPRRLSTRKCRRFPRAENMLNPA